MSRGKKICILLLVLLLAVCLCLAVRGLTDRNGKIDLKGVLDIDIADIEGIRWQYGDEKISVKKDASGWELEADSEVTLDGSAIDKLAESIADLEASSVITKEEQTDDYGFDNPNAELVVVTETADTTYTFGVLNSVTGEYYLKVTGSDNIFMVAEEFVENFEKGIDDIRASVAEAENDDSTDAENVEEQ